MCVVAVGQVGCFWSMTKFGINISISHGCGSRRRGIAPMSRLKNESDVDEVTDC